jgi:hypothetical protein
VLGRPHIPNSISFSVAQECRTQPPFSPKLQASRTEPPHPSSSLDQMFCCLRRRSLAEHHGPSSSVFSANQQPCANTQTATAAFGCCSFGPPHSSSRWRSESFNGVFELRSGCSPNVREDLNLHLYDVVALNNLYCIQPCSRVKVYTFLRFYHSAKRS